MVRNQWEPVRAFSPAPARARAFQPCCLLLSPLPFPSLPPVLTPHPPPPNVPLDLDLFNQ